MFKKKYLLFLSLFLIVNLLSCAQNLFYGGTVISKPDEYSHIYEAKDKVILQAVANVFNEKHIGANVTIDRKNLLVDSDYVESGNWRTKTSARVKRINWKECELILAVTTEMKTEKGWELRRLLEKEQYDVFFSVIDLRIHEEMAKIE
jgi:hypothetical protein